MEVTETESKEVYQLSANNSSSCGNLVVAETENESNQLSIDDPSADEHLGLINQQEYEAQFFGFTPKSFSDGLYNATAEYLHDGLLVVARKLAEEQFGGQSEEQLVDAAENAFQCIQPEIGKKFDKLEVYLSQNIFKIPPHVILEEDAVHKEHPTASNSTLIDCEKEIQTLTEKLTALRHARACFRQELSDTESLVIQMNDMLEKQRSILSLCQNKSAEHEEEIMLDPDVDK